MQNQDLYARLELIPSRSEGPATQQGTAISERLRQWANAVLTYFVGSKEPRITTKTDHEGQLFYEVYDPVDQRHHRFGSEAEVRGWLDERYYQ